jgi:hypothetical protein
MLILNVSQRINNLKKPGRPAAPCDARAAEMQARSLHAVRDLGIKNREIAKLVGRSAGAVGQALSANPPKNSQTLQDIYNHFFPTLTEDALTVHARELAVRAPETAALLSAVFRDLADLLSRPGGAKPGTPRN